MPALQTQSCVACLGRSKTCPLCDGKGWIEQRFEPAPIPAGVEFEHESLQFYRRDQGASGEVFTRLDATFCSEWWPRRAEFPRMRRWV